MGTTQGRTADQLPGEIAEPLAVLADFHVTGQARLGRHLHHQIAARIDLAGQHITAADFIAGKELGGLSFHLAFADDHPALPANTFPAADRTHVGTGPPGGLQQGNALIDRSFAVLGQEADADAGHQLLFHWFFK